MNLQDKIVLVTGVIGYVVPVWLELIKRMHFYQ